MTDRKVTDLTEISTPQDAGVLYIVQGNADYKVSLSKIKDYLGGDRVGAFSANDEAKLDAYPSVPSRDPTDDKEYNLKVDKDTGSATWEEDTGGATPRRLHHAFYAGG